jgi:hypothetical protein
MRFTFLGRGSERESITDKVEKKTENDFVKIGKMIGRLEEVATRFEQAADEILPMIERHIERGNDAGRSPGSKRC